MSLEVIGNTGNSRYDFLLVLHSNNFSILNNVHDNDESTATEIT